MDIWQNIDWEKLFTPDVPLLETFIRGTIIYLGLFAMLRVILKREAGSVAITDLLVVVLLADAAQNAMAGEYKSITDGILLVAVIIFWSHALDWLSFRYPFFRKLIKPGKLLLIKNGRMFRRNMKAELITEEELMSQLRLQGVSEVSNIKEAYMESNGEISIVQKKDKN